MLRSERQQQCVFSRRGLKFEVELTTEPFPQRESPRAINAAAERRVNDELHAARFIEEALDDERVLRRQATEDAVGVGEVGEEVGGGGQRNVRVFRETLLVPVRF